MTAIGVLSILVVAFLPTPQFSGADVDAFEKFCRTAWRAIVITLKLIALTIAFIVSCLEFGPDKVLVAIGYVVFGIIGLRLFLMATEFIIPDNLHRFLSEKSDPEYLLKIVF